MDCDNIYLNKEHLIVVKSLVFLTQPPCNKLQGLGGD